MNRRLDKFNELFHNLLLYGIRYIKTPQHVVDGFTILCFDREDKPMALIVLHKQFYSFEDNDAFFETSIIDDEGIFESPYWQTAQEVIDTLLSAM